MLQQAGSKLLACKACTASARPAMAPRLAVAEGVLVQPTEAANGVEHTRIGQRVAAAIEQYKDSLP